MSAFVDYLERIEGAVDDEDALKAIQTETATDEKLTQAERDHLHVAAGRFLTDFERMREAAAETAAEEEIMSGEVAE